MLLKRYIQSINNLPPRPAGLPFPLPPASRAALRRTTSLVPLDLISSLLSAVAGADLKKSGLRHSVRCSATKNLAYLLCRMEKYGSTFRCFRGGIVAKKSLPAADEPRTSYQGAFLCCLNVILRRQMCFRRTLKLFARRRLRLLRLRPVGLWPEAHRPSSLLLHCERIEACCAGNSSSPAAARRAAFFRPSRAVTASAPITAASPLSRVVSSPSNRHACFSTKPDSACPIPSPTMSASGIGIGWRSSARSFCWPTQPSGICGPALRNSG